MERLPFQNQLFHAWPPTVSGRPLRPNFCRLRSAVGPTRRRATMDKNRIQGIRCRTSGRLIAKSISIQGTGCKSGGCARSQSSSPREIGGWEWPVGGATHERQAAEEPASVGFPGRECLQFSRSETSFIHCSPMAYRRRYRWVADLDLEKFPLLLSRLGTLATEISSSCNGVA
jgi:hypothetical protein